MTKNADTLLRGALTLDEPERVELAGRLLESVAPPADADVERASESAPFVIEDYRQVYEAVALPVLIIDHESWRILAVNEAALRQYGYAREDFVGLPVLEVRPPEGREAARKVMTELPHGFWKITAVRHCRKDGSVFSADVWSRDTVVDGRAVRIATIHEVTERLQLQQELQQAQKMEVVGRLAGGIAHDFNNALTVIIAGAHFLREQFQDDPDAKTDLEDMVTAANRVALLTRHLLAFSRQQIMRVEVCPLAKVVERSVGLLQGVLEGHIEIQPRIAPGSWPVRVDPIQLEQVIMSMAVNAKDAMPGGGTLVLATENVSLPAREASHDASGYPGVLPGDYAMLSISDTGIGMDEITRARVFEPFFTTKPPPEGPGLGLSMAYGIVRQSGGFITVDSAPGVGTTFRIFLPCVSGTPEEGTASPTPAVTPNPAVPGDCTVLLVDSDDGVRRSTSRVLESLGYALVSSASAEEALTMVGQSAKVPDVLVTALNLPGMEGGELADRLQASFPGLGVLFLSGYALDEDEDVKDVARGRRLLRKPFPMESLIEAVRQVIADS